MPLYYRIVRELGGMTVQEMLQRISSSEVSDWCAIFSYEDDEAKKASKQ